LTIASSTSRHDWAFFRASGFDQVKLRNGSDIGALKQLDQKLWTALACPTTGLQFDDRTLAFIDTDGDGRIRAQEIIGATDWLSARLNSLDILTEAGDSLPLSAIKTSTPEGEQALASAKQILANLGKPDATVITAAQAGDTVKVFADTTFNGDGVIPVEAAEDEATAAVLTNVLACSTPVTDRSGKPGVDQAMVDAFYAAAQSFSDWHEAAGGDDVLPLGDGTGAACDAVAAVRTKVEDFFARCRLAAFDARAVEALNREESEYLSLAAKDLSITPDEVAGLPLARVSAGASLPLGAGLNPAWSAAITAFADAAVTPILGPMDALSEAGWAGVQARLAPHEAWRASKAGAAVEGLGIDRVREILAGDGLAIISGLLAKDLDLADEAKGIDDVNKLLHLRRDFFQLLQNFVSFRDFYTPGKLAIFQAGTLYLDERSCELCIEVSDMGAHGVAAPLSRAYIAYCLCTRKTTGQTMTIAAAFTGGDTDFLAVGRYGVFYDRDGNDWDAKITKIVEQPLSIPQAFWAPYKRLLRWIEDTMAKRAVAADAKAQGDLVAGAQATESKVEAGPPATPAEAPKSGMDIGVVAALGVAVGGIVAALGLMLEAFFGLGVWMPVGLIGLMLLISGPSMAIAWLKLRQRNLGPLLNANGWAVNQQARINMPFGASLTDVAAIPKGSQRDMKDAYAVSNVRRNLMLILLFFVFMAGLWFFGKFDGVLPESLDRATLIGPMDTVEAPAEAPATPAAPPVAPAK
jgi:hypothetical protein